MVLAVAVVVLAALTLATLGFRRLRSICLEQCVVKDMSSQVSITSGKMVKPDVIAENLGLRTGVNLALIDFERRREELLSRIPTLRSVSITRHLPDRVTIVAEERVPVAKMGVRGQRAPTGRVVDSEGMVFPCMRGVQLLPTIVEPSPGTLVGQKLKGRSLAALRLVETCREPEFGDLGLLDVDITKPDYLLVTLGGTYARAKIAWEGMDDTPACGNADLRERLSHLRTAMRTGAAGAARLWNATVPERIFADTERTE